ncbi:MAG TPA: hypothetical protein VIJ85_07145 [Rhizomicrobium sp.]
MIRPVAICCLALLLASCAAGQHSAGLPSAPPPGEPAGYAGIDASQLRVTMGNPAFARKEGAGIEMWRYDGGGCKAFFYLYPQGAALSVRHVETVPRPSDAAADVNCLNRMRVGGQATS